MIEYKTGSTRDAKEFVSKNVSKIGKPLFVEHVRDMDSISYETIIKGTDESLKIIGGLTSGYGGEGPSGLVQILKQLGINEDIAIMHAKEAGGNEYSFKLIL